MALVCPNCGMLSLGNAERSLDHLRCTECGQANPANILPLFVVTGASGSGKSTVLPFLRPLLPEMIVLDKDLLWGYTAGDKFHEAWLRLVYSLAQSGRHAVILGTIMPGDLAKSEHRGLVGQIHFLNLHCADAEREARLKARPEWRGSGGDAFITEHINFAHWLLDNASTAFNPPMPTVDTTGISAAQAAALIADWITARLDGHFKVPPAPFAASA